MEHRRPDLFPNFPQTGIKAARLELGVELTRRVVELRGLLLAEETGALESLRGPHPAIVDGFSWDYRIDPDRVVIRGSHDLPSPAERPLPLEVMLR